jgi:hypothetical protein
VLIHSVAQYFGSVVNVRKLSYASENNLFYTSHYVFFLQYVIALKCQMEAENWFSSSLVLNLRYKGRSCGLVPLEPVSVVNVMRYCRISRRMY